MGPSSGSKAPACAERADAVVHPSSRDEAYGFGGGLAEILEMVRVTIPHLILQLPIFPFSVPSRWAFFGSDGVAENGCFTPSCFHCTQQLLDTGAASWYPTCQEGCVDFSGYFHGLGAATLNPDVDA